MQNVLGLGLGLPQSLPCLPSTPITGIVPFMLPRTGARELLLGIRNSLPFAGRWLWGGGVVAQALGGGDGLTSWQLQESLGQLQLCKGLGPVRVVVMVAEGELGLVTGAVVQARVSTGGLLEPRAGRGGGN